MRIVSRMLAVAFALAVAGCGGGMDESSSMGTSSDPASSARQESATETVVPSHCPSGLPSCRSAEGR
jgi:hypothetical protein